jgi:hypothetical protein
MSAKEAIQQVLAQEPDLSLHGYTDEFSRGPYSKYHGPKYAVDRFKRDREAMLGERAIEQFECACQWLDRQPRTKNPNRKIGSSYTLKHMAEKEVELGYRVFIAAAIARGFKTKRLDDGPNVWINISNRAVTEFDKREKERVKGFNETIRRKPLFMRKAGPDEDPAPEAAARVEGPAGLRVTVEDPSMTLLLRFS